MGRGGAARESRAGGQPGRGGACGAPWRFPARGPRHWTWPGPQVGGKGAGFSPRGRKASWREGSSSRTPTQERDLCGQSPRGHTPQLPLCRHLSPELQVWGSRSAMSTQLRHAVGGQEGRRGWLGPAAEPWRRACSRPTPTPPPGFELKRGQPAKPGPPLAPHPACLACRAGVRCSRARQPRGHPGQKQPPGPPPPRDAEAIKGFARVAGAQPGAGPWACSVRINCWMTGWTHE